MSEFKPGDIVWSTNIYVGLWQLVKPADMSWFNNQRMWHAKLPFTTQDITCVCVLEQFIRTPTLLELGTLKLQIENLMRDIAMKNSKD